MRVIEQVRWWGAGLVAFALVLWVLGDVLLPFMLGAAIAYFTDPVADRLERMGFSRILATVMITMVSFAVASIIIVLLVPPLLQQIANAVVALPDNLEVLRNLAQTHLPSISEDGSALKQAVEKLRSNADQWSVSILKGIWTGGLAIVDFISIAVITPVVAFYLLYDWDRMIAWIDGALPRQHKPVIRELMRDVDRVLAGFVRGQFSVCAILGAFYAIALTVIGLQFGLLIGAFAGLISFIPFVGSIVGGLLSVGVALVQFWETPGMIAAVAGVFMAGQAIEGNVLTPKLVGGSVGLHPVWLLFALSAFGSLFGFAGLLIAVPAAAAIGVFGRFFLDRYKEGRLYLGPGEAEEEEEAQ